MPDVRHAEEETVSDQPMRASTEDWCERSDDGHAWSHTFHAGAPRVETRTCMLCQFLSVEPVRELLRAAAPAGTGSPTPADDPPSWQALAEQFAAKRNDLWTAWTRLAADLRQRGLPGLTDDPTEITRRACQWIETLIQQGIDQANVIQRYSRERDAARAELSQVQRERDAARESLKVVSSLHADSGLVIALAGERDEARSALAALRAEVKIIRGYLGNVFPDLDGRQLADLCRVWGERLDSVLAATALRALVTDQSPAAPPWDPETSNTDATNSVDQWNSLYPIGTAVTYWPLRNDDGTLYGGAVETRTRSEAWLLGGHTPVVMVEGKAGGVSLEHIRLRGLSPTSDTQTDSGGS